MGIYAIRCLPDGRVYVGQSRRIMGRWRDHLRELREGRGSPKLQKAWDQYGPCQFSFEVLEDVTNPDDMKGLEQHYIDTLRSVTDGLNTLPTAGSFKGYTPDAEARRKIGEASRNRSPETLSKMRQAKLGKKRGPPSPETRQKMSAALRGKSRGPMPEAQREAISRSHAGKAPLAAIQANTGRKHTDEAKQKMSLAKRAKRMEREANRVS